MQLTQRLLTLHACMQQMPERKPAPNGALDPRLVRRPLHLPDPPDTPPCATLHCAAGAAPPAHVTQNGALWCAGGRRASATGTASARHAGRSCRTAPATSVRGASFPAYTSCPAVILCTGLPTTTAFSNGDFDIARSMHASDCALAPREAQPKVALVPSLARRLHQAVAAGVPHRLPEEHAGHAAVHLQDLFRRAAAGRGAPQVHQGVPVRGKTLVHARCSADDMLLPPPRAVACGQPAEELAACGSIMCEEVLCPARGVQFLQEASHDHAVCIEASSLNAAGRECGRGHGERS